MLNQLKELTREKFSHASITFKLQTSSLLNSLFQYIKENKFILEFLALIKPDNIKLNVLLSAIEAGDTESEIYNDPECYLYLLYLIKEEQIPFWRGINVYILLIALMQLIKNQPLKKEDEQIKLLRNFKVNRFYKDGKLTLEGEHYLQLVCKRLDEVGYKIDYQELSKFVCDLAPVEQWLFNISYNPSNTENRSDRLTTLILNTPFLISGDNTSEIANFLLPSLSVINYLLQKISLCPMKIQPILSFISTETFRNMQSQDMHPIFVYVPNLESNQNNNDPDGPLITLINGISQTYWSTRLTAEERKIIFTRYIPQLQTMTHEAQNNNDKELAQHLINIIDKTVNFGPELHDHFKDHQTRFKDYHLYKFGHACGLFANYLTTDGRRIGESVEDRLILLTYKLYHSISPTKEDEFLWKNTIFTLYKVFEGIQEKKEIINTLLTLAQNASQPIDFIEQDNNDVDWKSWFEILNRTNDSKAIWEMALNERNDELLILITRYNLVFFHPYLPMTEEKQAQFRIFLNNKIGRALTAIEEENKYLRIENSETIEQNRKTFWALGENFWKQIMDGEYHSYGPMVFDKGLHGGPVEAGFYNSLKNGCEFAIEYPSEGLTVEFYKTLNKKLCAHFKGKETATEMTAMQAGRFRNCATGIKPSIRTGFGEEVLMHYFFAEIYSPAISTNSELSEDTKNIKYMEKMNIWVEEIAYKTPTLTRWAAQWKQQLEAEKNLSSKIEKKYPESQRWVDDWKKSWEEKVELLNNYLSEIATTLNTKKFAALKKIEDVIIIHYLIHSENEQEEIIQILFKNYNKKIVELNRQLLTVNELSEKQEIINNKISTIANLFQLLEWLHPFVDGQGRTDLVLQSAALTKGGVHPVILERPYFSTTALLSEWLEYLLKGLDTWKVEAKLIDNVIGRSCSIKNNI